MSSGESLTPQQLDAIDAHPIGRYNFAPDDATSDTRGVILTVQERDALTSECRRLLGENQQLRDALAELVAIADEDEPWSSRDERWDSYVVRRNDAENAARVALGVSGS